MHCYTYCLVTTEQINESLTHVVVLHACLNCQWLNVTFHIFQINFLQIGLNISMTCSITFVLAGVSQLYLCVYFVCVFSFFFFFNFTCVYVFVCLEHDFNNNKYNNNK